MYTLLNNRESSKFDLYLPGRLVAALHYKIEPDEFLFVYCEAIETRNVEQHCTELMRRALEETLNRRIPITVSCPIALKYMSEDSGIRAQLPVLPQQVEQKPGARM